ncbi:hypothetical protein U0035_22445 [Niabella yanshanensis]|uniref:Uncharacterized protein n=1 Tax=Niabella yanshanensis TaxID=577386 RepID=A0ABZ0W5A4_9BACT|nr:hypothetical protein [Niabella yanshanensis]WQD38438.1 hypothetical protein U0035_22445 [Niabella yanshanensis]
MNRISKMLLLLLLVILPVVLFVLDNRQVLAENAKDALPVKEPARSAGPVFSVFNGAE